MKDCPKCRLSTDPAKPYRCPDCGRIRFESMPNPLNESYQQPLKLLRIGPTDAELAERWRFVAVMAMMFAVGGWLTVGALVLATIYR